MTSVGTSNFFGEVRLGKRFDAIVMGLHPAQHNFSAGPVVAVKRERDVLVKLRPICRNRLANAVKDRDG